MSRAHLLALPSIEDNCPMSVLEAAAAGVPVLAANAGGIPELVEDGVTGLLCDPTDANSMAAGVDRILSDKNTAVSLAKNARDQARQKFRPELVARRHLEIYRELLSNRL
jgi:glycosyltransferase involved in cell wall biosynthesis